MKKKPTTFLAGFDQQDTKSRIQGSSSLRFTPKSTFSLKNNALCGITLFPWLSILWNYGVYIDFIYIPRVIFLTALSLVNSALALIEWLLWESRIQATKLPDDPIFIIGHPRTGTTLLHNLLSLDTENFYTSTTFTVGFPSSFIWFESLGKRLFAGVIEKTRPMDNMPLHFDLPQEDELATNMLSGGKSYYMPLWFMRQEPMFRPYISFDGEEDSEVNDKGHNKADISHARAEWTKHFLYFMKKITLRYQLMQSSSSSSPKSKSTHPGARLLIKSPVHTGRVKLLRELFPRASFIYLHRNPYEVLQSSAHMADTAYWFCYLNVPTNEQIAEFILWQFQTLWRLYNKDACLVNANANAINNENDNENDNGNDDRIKHRATRSSRRRLSRKSVKEARTLAKDVMEVAYKEELVGDTLSTLRAIYKHIGVKLSKDREQVLYEKPISMLSEYKVNSFVELPQHVEKLIEERWRGCFDAFGYEIRNE